MQLSTRHNELPMHLLVFPPTFVWDVRHHNGGIARRTWINVIANSPQYGQEQRQRHCGDRRKRACKNISQKGFKKKTVFANTMVGSSMGRHREEVQRTSRGSREGWCAERVFNISRSSGCSQTGKRSSGYVSGCSATCMALDRELVPGMLQAVPASL